mmetsp:Transcript_34629/g.104534  ORF Transcript_34629/g.104534 Transcript_34629/m.104534 type:complete len:244 (-) Transcript_34629:244-975(-)
MPNRSNSKDIGCASQRPWRQMHSAFPSVRRRSRHTLALASTAQPSCERKMVSSGQSSPETASSASRSRIVQRPPAQAQSPEHSPSLGTASQRCRRRPARTSSSRKSRLSKNNTPSLETSQTFRASSHAQLTPLVAAARSAHLSWSVVSFPQCIPSIKRRPKSPHLSPNPAPPSSTGKANLLVSQPRSTLHRPVSWSVSHPEPHDAWQAPSARRISAHTPRSTRETKSRTCSRLTVQDAVRKSS